MRAVDGTKRKDRRKKTLELAKGYWGRRSTNNRVARNAVMKSGTYAYRDRKAKKRDFRKLWIARINAATRAEGMSYSDFIHALKLLNVSLDRKVLSNMAIDDKDSFKSLIERAKSALN